MYEYLNRGIFEAISWSARLMLLLALWRGWKHGLHRRHPLVWGYFLFWLLSAPAVSWVNYFYGHASEAYSIVYQFSFLAHAVWQLAIFYSFLSLALGGGGGRRIMPARDILVGLTAILPMGLLIACCFREFYYLWPSLLVLPALLMAALKTYWVLARRGADLGRHAHGVLFALSFMIALQTLNLAAYATELTQYPAYAVVHRLIAWLAVVLLLTALWKSERGPDTEAGGSETAQHLVYPGYSLALLAGT